MHGRDASRARLLTRDGARTSSTFAVTGKELVEQLLERRVLGHDVVFAQVVAAGGAGVHLRSERPLETGLGRGGREGGWLAPVRGRRSRARRGRTLQTLCEQIVVMGWNASSWQQTHMKICSILRRKFFYTRAGQKEKICYSCKNNLDGATGVIQSCLETCEAATSAAAGMSPRFGGFCSLADRLDGPIRSENRGGAPFWLRRARPHANTRLHPEMCGSSESHRPVPL